MRRPKIRIKRPRIRIRWRKRSSWWVVGLAVAFFATLFALHIVLMWHATALVRDVLDSKVREATDGFYTSSFDHVEVNYASRSLIIHNLRLLPDSVQISSSTGVKPGWLVEAVVPQFHIEGINLRKAYLKKALDIRRLLFQNPQIKLYVDFDQKSETADALRKNFNNRLSYYFDQLQARQLLLLNGRLELHTTRNGKKSRLYTPLNGEATDLLVKADFKISKEDWIKLDRFILQAGPVKGYMADDTYSLRLKSITASSADSSFFIEHFQLTPTASVQEILSRTDQLDNIYKVAVPQLYTYGIDFKNLFNHRSFTAAEITMLAPVLEFFDARPRTDATKENFRPEDLYPAMEKILDRVSVKKINVQHGSTLIRKLQEQPLTKLQVTIKEAQVFNFVLDSAARYRNDKLFFADSARFRLSNYQLRLSDELHLLKADELVINSNLKQASAVNLRLEPDLLQQHKQKRTALYKASVPKLNISGIDFLQLYNNNRLLVDTLLVNNPQITYTFSKKTQKRKNAGAEFKQQDLYGLISDYLYQLKISNLNLQKGTVSVERQTGSKLEVFNTKVHYAHLWNLQVDSSSAYQLNKLFYADNFDLELSDYKHTLPDGIHAVEAKAIGISTLKDRIYLAGISIYNTAGYDYPFREIESRNIATLLNIQVPYLELKGVDILKSYLTKKLDVKEVLVPEPLIQIGRRAGSSGLDPSSIMHSRAIYELVNEFTEVISVASLNLSNAKIETAFYTPNGLLQLNSPAASVGIKNFRFDAFTSRNPKRLFFADAVSVQARDFTAQLPDERYLLKADALSASTAAHTITAEGVVLEQPVPELDETSLMQAGKRGALSFSLPLVAITGIDFEKAYYDEVMHVDSIYARQPKLAYYKFSNGGKRNRKQKIELPANNLYQAISPFFSQLSVGAVHLEQGSFSAYAGKPAPENLNLMMENISIAVDKFHVDSLAVKDEQRFFYSENIRVHIGEYHWFLPDGIHKVSAGNMDLSTRSNLIRASAVKLAPLVKDSLTPVSADQYQILVPEVVLTGIAFDDIFEKEEFRLKKLEIINPDIVVQNLVQPVGRKSKKAANLPELLSAGLNLLQIDEAVITKGSLHYSVIEKGKTNSIAFPALEAKLTNFSVTPKIKAQAAKPFFSDNLEVQLFGWKRLLPDSLHWLEAATISFSAKDSLLLASKLEIYPDPDSITSINEKSLYSAYVPDVSIEGLHYQKLANDSLVLRKLMVIKPDVHILKMHEPKNAAQQVGPALLKLIKADSISVVDASLVLQNIKLQDTSRFELNNMFIKADHFRFDSVEANNQERILFSKNLEIGLNRYKVLLDNGFYELEAKEIGLSTGRQQIWADSLKITPTLDKENFAQQKGYETDQFILRNKRLLLDQVDLRKLFHEKTIEADLLEVDGFNLYVFRDKRFPFLSTKRPAMPQELLRNSSWKILLRETNFTNGYVAYAERVKGASSEGFIDLTNLQLHSNAITNYPFLVQNGHVTQIKASMYLMGRGHLKAQLAIPLADTTNQHVFSGSLDQMNLSHFNPILEKTAFISIKSGHAAHIDFKVVADEEQASGHMDFEYDALKVALVNKKTGKSGGLFKKVGSSVANLFLHTSNTVDEKQENLRSGNIEVKRDEKRSIVNYWVKTLIEGFKSSIGI